MFRNITLAKGVETFELFAVFLLHAKDVHRNEESRLLNNFTTTHTFFYN
jgi:hypothetical protein